MARTWEYDIVDVTYMRHTAKAVLVLANEKEHWLPISTLRDPPNFDELAEGEDIELEVATWKIDQAGLG